MWTMLASLALGLIELAVMARAITRPHRDPSSRIAWVVVIAVLPVAGILAYLLFGETNIGRKRVARARKVLEGIPPPAAPSPEDEANLRPEFPDRVTPLFRLGETINGFLPVGGNKAYLTANSNAAIDAMVADMDAAEDHIHLTFYIWLADNNGLKVVEALKRAAGRGVTCRAMADGLGSRAMIRSKHWKDMRDAGVKMSVALRIGNPLLRPLQAASTSATTARRGHRRPDHVHPQHARDPDPGDAGFPAQVIATGPTIRASAMPETFETLMYAARRKLVITTPYYVPNDSMQAALCAAANRGVDTTIVFPARNDSMVTGAASRSYYRELLQAGVNIHEFVGGLLHAKTMTVDDDVTLIGSANMDRRSFDLNYENNILLWDEALTAELRRRQETFLASSNVVTLEEVEAWSTGRVLWNNTIGMLGPLL